MIYRFSITTAKSPATSVSAQQCTRLKLRKGVIHKIDIVFPPGCLALLHVHINDALHQVWPTNPSQSFASDSETISFQEYFPIDYEPYELQAWTYNDDDTYSHEVIIRIGLLPEHIVSPFGIPSKEVTLW